MAEAPGAMEFIKVEVSDPRFETGGIRQLTACSRSTGGRCDVSLWEPPDASEMRDLPIVVLLHGVYGSHWSWFFQGGAHRVAGESLSAGKIRPMVLACPSDGLRGEGTGYLSAEGEDFETWICSVPELVARVAPCCSDRSPVFIAGLSMGGYGALRLGAKFPELFSGVSAHSPITRAEEFRSFITDPEPVVARATAQGSILHWMDAHRDRLPPLRLDCGADDTLLGGCKEFHRALDERGIAHEFEVLPGAHEWSYWQQNLVRSLIFFDLLSR